MAQAAIKVHAAELERFCGAASGAPAVEGLYAAWLRSQANGCSESAQSVLQATSREKHMELQRCVRMGQELHHNG